MAQPAPRTRLEQHVQLAHLSIPEFVTRFLAAAIECGEGKTHVSERQVKRWLAGEAEMPRPVCRRILEHWWREPVSRLLGPPESSAVAPAVAMTEEELIVNAGRDSTEHAINAAAALDPSAREHLHSVARRLARAWCATPSLARFIDLVRLRDTVYEQLDRTHKPRQQAELYLLAGLVCGLLSSASWDLGHPDVAEEQARAAHTYGSIIDHPSLCTWARSLQVTVMVWTDRPRRGATLAAAALDTAPPGTARAQLYDVQARSLALIGARQEVRAAYEAADEEAQRAGDDPFLDDIGGLLAFSPARLAMSAGAAFVGLGESESAEAQATTALQLFSEVPETDRWVAGELAARVDLATARALRNDLAGAEDALGPVFAVDPEKRTESVVRRLTALGRMVGASRYRDAVEANRIGEAIENVTSHRFPRSATGIIINPAG